MCVCGLWSTTSNLGPHTMAVGTHQLTLFNLRGERRHGTTYHLPDIPTLVPKMVPVKHTRVLGGDDQPAIRTRPPRQLCRQQPLPSWLKISVVETRATIRRRLGGVKIVGAETPLTGFHCSIARKICATTSTLNAFPRHLYRWVLGTPCV